MKLAIDFDNSTVDGYLPTNKVDAWVRWNDLCFDVALADSPWGRGQQPNLDGRYEMRPYPDGFEYDRNLLQTKGEYITTGRGQYEYLHVPLVHEDGDTSVHRVRCALTPGKLYGHETVKSVHVENVGGKWFWEIEVGA
jgi:hypothetical protein